MTIEFLQARVKQAEEALDVEMLFAGFKDTDEVLEAKQALSVARQELARVEASARREREHAESCRIAAAMQQAPTEAEALEILRKANEWRQDQRADAAVHIGSTEDAPEDDNYAGLPNEDGINEDSQNVFCSGPY